MKSPLDLLAHLRYLRTANEQAAAAHQKTLIRLHDHENAMFLRMQRDAAALARTKRKPR